jgi:hypothetical protein
MLGKRRDSNSHPSAPQADALPLSYIYHINRFDLLFILVNGRNFINREFHIYYCREDGIRTHGPLSRPLVFKTSPINHSGTSLFRGGGGIRTHTAPKGGYCFQDSCRYPVFFRLTPPIIPRCQ